jgi:hypothetical protein
MPPLFSYEIVRLLRKFARGPRDKIDFPILEQAADEIEGLRALLLECQPFLFDASAYASASTPKSKSEDQNKPRATIALFRVHSFRFRREPLCGRPGWLGLAECWIKAAEELTN